MGDLIDRDAEHLRLLKLGYYLTAGVMAFMPVIALLFVAMGAAITSGGLPMQGGEDPRLLGAIVLGIGIAVFVFGLAGTLLTYYTGRSIAARRRRTLCLVIAALHCLSFPWGTALGVCTFIVLDRPSVRELFARPV
jgi:DMSO/TMAO reductase YedYZ heme-binding membrane subunit